MDSISRPVMDVGLPQAATAHAPRGIAFLHRQASPTPIGINERYDRFLVVDPTPCIARAHDEQNQTDDHSAGSELLAQFSRLHRIQDRSIRPAKSSPDPRARAFGSPPGPLPGRTCPRRQGPISDRPGRNRAARCLYGRRTSTLIQGGHPMRRLIIASVVVAVIVGVVVAAAIGGGGGGGY